MLKLFIWLTMGAWAMGKAVPSLAAEGEELLGRRAPEWNAVDWLQSEPLRLADLRGRVVLIRWWTDTCPMCARSAPALNEFHDLYAKRGLVVIGMYHPKPSTTPSRVPGRSARRKSKRWWSSAGSSFRSGSISTGRT